MSEPPMNVNVITETFPTNVDMKLPEKVAIEVISYWYVKPIPEQTGGPSTSQSPPFDLWNQQGPPTVKTYTQVYPVCIEELLNAQDFKREPNDLNVSFDLQILQIKLDVKTYRHDDLKVSVENGFIYIMGKHGERDDGYSLVSQQFLRKYELPAGVDLEKISSRLLDNGILLITVPYEVQQGREIPVLINDEPPSKKVRKEENESQNKKTTCMKE